MIGDLTLDDNNDKALDQIVFGIKECALACIPRGHVKNAKPFCNDNLQLLKEDRDRVRLAAEISGQLQDCVTLRQKNAALRKAILQAKQTSYQTFLEDLDYRKDGPKAFKFVSALNGKRIQASYQFNRIAHLVTRLIELMTYHSDEAI
ncbi:hypothetical protein JTE90_015561 [Oedothorax gibbosus]|uniref:Uncharacterized protein n=1 Tax=Oedothorax gibbosus TaxID=931172 RepID=A0AAV6UKM7_9ARAC|nr:hypothetical protein JTE90_015561 [Oedothorax gibbosus]